MQINYQPEFFDIATLKEEVLVIDYINMEETNVTVAIDYM